MVHFRAPLLTASVQLSLTLVFTNERKLREIREVTTRKTLKLNFKKIGTVFKIGKIELCFTWFLFTSILNFIHTRLPSIQRFIALQANILSYKTVVFKILNRQSRRL